MEDNNNHDPSTILIFIAAIIVTVSWLLLDELVFIGTSFEQEVASEEQEIDSTEQELTSEEPSVISTEQEIDSTEQELELNRVYEDLDIETTGNKISISDSGDYYIYRGFNTKNSIINFIEKVETSDSYEYIDSYSNGSYIYIVFRYAVTDDMEDISDEQQSTSESKSEPYTE